MKIIKINTFTLYFLCIAFLCGYIKVALLILFIVLAHEFGHVFFIKVFSYKIIDITIYPFGGITKVKKDLNIPLKHEFLIALGGVFAQTLLYGILLFPLRDITKSLFLKYNTAILFFNLLPIIPLDGSILLNTALSKFFSYQKSYYLYSGISIITIILYIVLNFYKALNNYFIIGLFCFKTYEAIKNYKYYYNRFLLERYLNDYTYKKIETRAGDLKILKRETFQFFKEGKNIVSEKKKLANRFDKTP